ncbi:hypothetical protein EFA69_12905 [Rufibacter immobilis]|uniref:PNPLA domain-containing protein n=1 Tax=Rufibacter immobilis TaxID=1348778 RepID=A0A3M9MNF6_9BACT|nr:patatin-like phospholipase family protein [Rufibacter immobilis]RNI27074.1 hypothetical protein EFA69_12905 [Rufibacter immobilis]
MAVNRTTPQMREFTSNNGRVKAILAQLKADLKGKEFSDVIDPEGHQYVDLVMEGGGMLGIALVGYVYALEEMGIRFLQLGGTSAGSINALLMAAAGKRNEKTSQWLLEELSSQDFYQFVDGDADAKDFVDALLHKKKWYTQLFKTTQVLDNFREDLGLNPGHAFHQWVKSLLAKKKIETLAQLRERRKEGLGNLLLRNTDRLYDFRKAEFLALIAADVTTQTKVVFPEMANMYWANPEEINPADFVRASMSIPLFFHPYKVKNLPYDDEAFARWRQVGYTGNVPDEVVFVDGGIMSNFPIDLFHEHGKIPAAPTFGVKLGVDRQSPRTVHKITDLVVAIFDAARQVHDFDFILRNPDYKHLVQCLPTDELNWLDFNMSTADKVKLFEIGVQGAADFLRTFNWKKYKQIRGKGATSALPSFPLAPTPN